MSPLVFHIPHASRLLPEGAREELLLDEAGLEEELLRLTDAHCDRLFAPSIREGEATLLFPWSRLYVDVERFRDPSREPMAARGMGAVYTRTSAGLPLRPEPFDPEPALRGCYDPHHARLAAATRRAIESCGRALLVDCHSFPSKPLPCDESQAEGRPEICLGTDPFHTPERLVESLEGSFARAGLRCRRDDPYAGTMVPLEFLGREPRVLSLMIEVRRDLYMDETSGRMHAAADLGRVLDEAIENLRRLIA